jgi:hypothetical protein
MPWILNVEHGIVGGCKKQHGFLDGKEIHPNHGSVLIKISIARGDEEIYDCVTSLLC